ncbi:MAG: helix-turn-helix domain-containing protein [Rickettsiales bacterium]|jgi:hypothetical protein|nr:helix-turn-helix domain-containing protein [Rickettsiales bacterium]
MDDKFITTTELAALLKCKPNTIERQRTNRTCPVKWYRVGGRVLYKISEVLEYIESQKRDTTCPKRAITTAEAV